jgi:hypothetical protein
MEIGGCRYYHLEQEEYTVSLIGHYLLKYLGGA